MYLTHFGLRENPFNITPDPRFFYANPVYHEAYASLLMGVQERKGFIVMTGEVGTGKTTLLRKLMKNLEANVCFAYVYNTTLTFDELLTYTCDELGIKVEGEGRLKLIQALNAFLIDQLRRGGTGVLLIDEAQHLGEDALENLRLLSNLETSTEKLLQIVLVGQPELDAKLALPGLRQLRQRISLQCRLDRLRDREVESYIRFRLETAGAPRTDLFSSGALERIIRYSTGIPRLINVICDNALLIAYASSARSVSAAIVDEVATDLGLNAAPVSPGPSAVVRVPERVAHAAPAVQAAPVAQVAPAIRQTGDALRRRALRRSWGWRFRWGRLGGLVTVLLAVAGALAYASTAGKEAAGVGASIRSAWESIGGNTTTAWRRAALAPALSGDTPGDARSTGGPALPAGAPTPPPAVASPAAAPTAQPAELPPREPGDAQPARPRPAPTGARHDRMVIPQGATVADIMFRVYGDYNVLALDLLKEANPQVEDLNWIKAGELLRLPNLDAATLIRKQPDGTYRLVTASFLSREAADRRRAQIQRAGYDAVIVSHKLSESLSVQRVEVTGLRTMEAAQQAWETARANCWLAIADTPCERKAHG
jgi:type II secretory pathway predicted ATPase ExeA